MNIPTKSFLTLVAFLITTVSIAQRSAEATIRSISPKFSESLIQGDHKLVASYYSRDARLLPPNQDMVRGRVAIEEFWRILEQTNIVKHVISPEEINVFGEEAYEIGYYEGETLGSDGQHTSWRGKHVVIWKKEEGRWKIHVDAWSRVN